MKGVVVAAIAGALFAVGLAVAGMTVPARVIAFLDVGGAWDPTLAFVMGGAIAVYAPLYRLIRARTAPIFDARFHVPTSRTIDAPLVVGAALFGIGWGISGYCPGPALASLATGAPALTFFVAAIAGIAIARVFGARSQPR